MSRVTIVRLLPDLLRLNGSLGNAEVLATRLRWWGFDVGIQDVTQGGVIPKKRPHAVIIGHGTSSTLAPAATSLSSWVTPLSRFATDGTAFLGVGVGGDLLGQSIRGLDGVDYEGVGLTQITGQLGGPRASTEVAGRDRHGRDIAGYLNDATIRHNPGHQPLFSVDNTLPASWRGHTAPGAEGVVQAAVWASALSGPLLALNPHLADDIIDHMCTTEKLSRDDHTAQHVQVDTAATRAREAIRSRLGLA